MAVVARNHETGEAIDLGRECWFSEETISMLERACDNPKVDPRDVLRTLLRYAIGCPLSLVAKMMGETKNVTKTKVVTTRKMIRRSELRRQRQRSLFM